MARTGTTNMQKTSPGPVAPPSSSNECLSVSLVGIETCLADVEDVLAQIEGKLGLGRDAESGGITASDIRSRASTLCYRVGRLHDALATVNNSL